MSRSYGRFPGERGTHFIAGDAILEVVHTDFLDNNRAQYRYYGGDRSGEEFDQTAEHFEPLPKDERCPACGDPVYSFFDHVDRDGDCSDAAQSPKLQFVAVEFKPGQRPYTYRNNGPTLFVGDRVRVPAFRGDGWSAVTVVAVDVPEPTEFEAKAILGRVEDVPAEAIDPARLV